ncbi:hypothetical protein E2C01_080623 [Portunus trituberculatus]|uniref:Uncharacterized protein n=1 Tax=Portunus trituberculatus TaxID=210409 RepID=A0A5B7ITQ9_PORTR|nr:hypothetical protein [Portunus trituberculatus]
MGLFYMRQCDRKANVVLHLFVRYTFLDETVTARLRPVPGDTEKSWRSLEGPAASPTPIRHLPPPDAPRPVRATRPHNKIMPLKAPRTDRYHHSAIPTVVRTINQQNGFP